MRYKINHKKEGDEDIIFALFPKYLSDKDEYAWLEKVRRIFKSSSEMGNHYDYYSMERK